MIFMLQQEGTMIFLMGILLLVMFLFIMTNKWRRSAVYISIYGLLLLALQILCSALPKDISIIVANVILIILNISLTIQI